MEFLVGPPSRWLVTLKSGSIVEIWADAYTEEGDHYLFSAFVRASSEEQQHVEVVSRTPDGESAVIVIARVPATEVESLEGGPV